jgi:hypothetical protein
MELTNNGEIHEHPRMYAFRWPLDQALASRPVNDPQGLQPPEETLIPRSLAKSIVEFADLSEQQQERSAALGGAAVDVQAVGGRHSVRWQGNWQLPPIPWPQGVRPVPPGPDRSTEPSSASRE